MNWRELLAYRRPAFFLTVLLVVLSLVGIGYRGGLLYGIDFTGGLQVMLEFDRPIDVDRMNRIRSIFDERLFEAKVNTVGLQGEEERRGLMVTVRARPLSDALTERLYRIGRDRTVERLAKVRPEGRSVAVPGGVLRENFSLGQDTGTRVNLRTASRETIRSRVRTVVNETLSEEIIRILRWEFVGDTTMIDLNWADAGEIQDWLARRQTRGFVEAFERLREDGRLEDMESLEELLERYDVDPGRFESIFSVGEAGRDRIDLRTIPRDGFREIVFEEFFSGRYEGTARSLVERRERMGLFRTPRDVFSHPAMTRLQRGPLETSMTLSPFVLQRSEMVSPAIGTELVGYAALAILLSLLGILAYLYVRFELMYSLGAIAAILHDILITVGLLTLVGVEFNVPVVAAVLTIIGYSLNDTIVNFDRVRENRALMGYGAGWYRVINRSVFEVLNRTLVTSLTTFLAVLVLYVYGGIALRAFSITLLIGVVLGTFSSIYVANVVLYRLQADPGDEEG